jgi:hypothetical protein
LGQAVCGVCWQHRHHGLRKDGAVVQLRGDQVHRGPGELAAGSNGAGVGVQAGKGR